jgi:hypothetical protein
MLSSFLLVGTTHEAHAEPFRRGPDEGQIARAKVLAEDLLLVVRQEHAKAATAAQQQQMELHQAQQQYAAYSLGVSSRYIVCMIPGGADKRYRAMLRRHLQVLLLPLQVTGHHHHRHLAALLLQTHRARAMPSRPPRATQKRMLPIGMAALIAQSALN